MRLIDADALNEKLCKTTIFIKGGEMFQRMINDAPTIEPDADTISRQDAVKEIDSFCGEVWTESEADFARGLGTALSIVESLPSAPSAEAEDRLYIKIYADDEPSVKAEKLYQICGETQNREVTEWLKEYFPLAPDSRQRGKWVMHGEPPWYVRECSICGTKWHQWSGDENPNYCGNCGARMYKGGGSE